MGRLSWMVALVAVGALVGCGDDSGGTNAATTDVETTLETTADLGEPMYCPGIEPSAQMACRTSADCESNDQECAVAQSDCPGPGCASDCDVDADCDEAGVCYKTGVGCCGDAGTCIPACTVDSCGTEFSCGPDGHCAPIACDDGHACADGFRCEVGGAGADAHGCARIPCDEAGALACSVVSECVDGACQQIACTLDSDCPCGSCIISVCWERPWFCFELPA